MSGLAAVLGKELRQAFVTPIAYTVMAVFWGLAGYYFSFNVFFVNAADMVNTFHNMSILLMLIVPLLTMRLFAEENRSGTMELLLALPLGEAGIVLGKYLAALAVLFLMLLGTASAIVPLTLFARPDLGPIIGGYLGVALLGAAFTAIGVFVSALCTNQLVAAVTTWAVLVLLWYVDYAAAFTGDLGLTRALKHLCFSEHYVELIRGVLPLASIAYLGGIVVVALAATTQAVRMRRA
jgi:ABC-2 type transport system permease protein